MKPITKEVSDAFQRLEADVGSLAAHSIYKLIKAVIVEQALPDESSPPEKWTASNNFDPGQR